MVVCSQSSFYVTRARTDDKNRKNTLFLSLEKGDHFTRKQLFINVPFFIDQTFIESRKKEMCVDNKVPDTFGEVYCPLCKNEKCVYISTKKNVKFLRL